MNVKDYGLRYLDAETPIFSELSFSITQGSRIALCGKNGCGKSTLIKMILKKIGFDVLLSNIEEAGLCEVAPGLVVSYVDQDTSKLIGQISDYCKKHNFDQSIFCAVLRKLDFERSQFSKNMKDFSDGQKKKILIASSLLTPAHLYIWDEPFNYIDVFSRMQIERLLLKYQPTMLFVEHDIKFREKIATHMIEFK